MWAGGEGWWWREWHVLQEGKQEAAAATTVADLGAQLSLLNSSWQTSCPLDRSPRRTSNSPYWTPYWSKMHNIIICYAYIMSSDYHSSLVNIRHHTQLSGTFVPVWLQPTSPSDFSCRLSQQLPLRVPPLTPILASK